MKTGTTTQRRTNGTPAALAAALLGGGLLGGLAGCDPATEFVPESFLGTAPGESRWTFSTDEEGEREAAVFLGRGEARPLPAGPDDGVSADTEPVLTVRVEIDGRTVYASCRRLPGRFVVRGRVVASGWPNALCVGGPRPVFASFPLEGLDHRVSHVVFRRRRGEPGPAVAGIVLVRTEPLPETWTTYGTVRTKPPPDRIWLPVP